MKRQQIIRLRLAYGMTHSQAVLIAALAFDSGRNK